MKNNIYNKVTIAGASLLVVLLTAFSGCSVDEIETFDEHDYLSFQKSNMAYTFAFSSDERAWSLRYLWLMPADTVILIEHSSFLPYLIRARLKKA